MLQMFPTRTLPEIRINSDDYNRVLLLAEAVERTLPYVSFYLERELQRAAICYPWEPAGVSMGTVARFRINDEPKTRSGRLTYPGVTDPQPGDICILTPLGAALIGMHPGNSIDWMEDNRLHTVTVENAGSSLAS
jgi:regulator of nucleoside diphosphate kinase